MKRTHAVFLGVALLMLLVAATVFYSGDRRPLGPAPQVPEEPIEESVTLIFVGDIMLDRGVRNAIEREGSEYPLSGVSGLFSGVHLAVGNLEGTFTNNASISQGDNSVLRFTFDPALAHMLKESGFSGFSLANNHALDFGRAGYDSTQGFLSTEGLFHFGSPSNDIDLSAKVGVLGEVVCFVGYHSLFRADTAPVVLEIEMIRPLCSFVVVFAHWGEEYQDSENALQRSQGRSFIDAGADLVIGHHPHVVQPVEIYQGKAIFYSLGNFLFDQDFSLETRQSLAVRLSLTRGKQLFELVPIEMSRARLYYPTEESYRERLDVIVSKLPEELKASVETDAEFTLPR